MFPLSTFRRCMLLTDLNYITTASMNQNNRTPARRHPGPRRGRGRGRGKSLTTTATSRANAAATKPALIPRVVTPPLSEAVPLDTPRFADLARDNLLHPTLLQTITEDLKFDHMMPVQSATLRELLAGSDCLAQAKTGTGKTLAFLLPAIQTMINKRNRRKDSGISLLVISPTRELAMQIAKEAKALLQRIPHYRISLAIGGENHNAQAISILHNCDILVATPGRLYDHLSDENTRSRFNELDTLVLDEADRLLDMGFLKDLQAIIRCLPDKEATKRQGMLFSATIEPHVEKVAHLVLSQNYKFISTIPKGEVNTHERVPQHIIVVPAFADVAPALIGSIASEIALLGSANQFKAIVFAPAARLVDFYAHVLGSLSGMPQISALHSKLSQSKRTKITQAFREAKNGILVATDVVARGMDFPLVTNVFQVGIPMDRQSYIHRLGRTARAGAEGRGTFIITQAERLFPVYFLKGINFEPAEADISSRTQVTGIVQKMESQQATYQAWMGYYNSHLKTLQWDKEHLVQEANKYAAEGLGSPEVPGMLKKTVGKMGLKGVRGLNIVKDQKMRE